MITPYRLVNDHRLRIVYIIISRYSTAIDIITTVPVVQSQYSKSTITITIGYIPNDKVNGVTVNSVSLLSDWLSILCNMKVRLVLVRIDNHYSDATLLCKYLATIIGKSIQKGHNFKTMMTSITKYIVIGNYTNIKTVGIKGFRIKVNGRLDIEASRPRQTSQQFTIGVFNSNRLQASSFTTVNSKGSITVKVWLAI